MDLQKAVRFAQSASYSLWFISCPWRHSCWPVYCCGSPQALGGNRTVISSPPDPLSMDEGGLQPCSKPLTCTDAYVHLLPKIDLIALSLPLVSSSPPWEKGMWPPRPPRRRIISTHTHVHHVPSQSSFLLHVYFQIMRRVASSLFKAHLLCLLCYRIWYGKVCGYCTP